MFPYFKDCQAGGVWLSARWRCIECTLSSAFWNSPLLLLAIAGCLLSLGFLLGIYWGRRLGRERLVYVTTEKEPFSFSSDDESSSDAESDHARHAVRMSRSRHERVGRAARSRRTGAVEVRRR